MLSIFQCAKQVTLALLWVEWGRGTQSPLSHPLIFAGSMDSNSFPDYNLETTSTDAFLEVFGGSQSGVSTPLAVESTPGIGGAHF